jgi:HSP20 family protein
MNPSSAQPPHAPFVYLGNGEDLGRTLVDHPQASNEPHFYISQDENSFHLEVDLPGVKACDSLVELINGVLYITGTRHFHNSQKVYRKIFCLHSAGMDLSNVRANLASNGVLLVTVPKTASPKIQVIPVTTQECASPVVHHASTRSNEETTAEHY